MRTTALLIVLLLAAVPTANSSQTQEGTLVTRQKEQDNVNSMLDYMKTTLRKGNLPAADQGKMENITRLIQDSLLVALYKVRGDANAEIRSLLANVQVCNNNSVSLLAGVDGTKGIVTSSRGEHKDCRGLEVAALAEKTIAHDVLQSFIETIPTLDQKPALDSPIEKFREYTNKIKKLACTTRQEDVFNDHDTVNTNKTAEHDAVQIRCNKLQRAFESSFCAWRIELVDACSTLTTCYNTGVSSYMTRSHSLRALVGQWKTEFTGLQKILCYVGVWMSDSNATTVDQNKVGECDSLQVDASSMELHFPEPEAKGVCDTAPVTIYPCENDWQTVEYSNITNALICEAGCPAANEEPNMLGS